jgi:hypothetical protein
MSPIVTTLILLLFPIIHPLLRLPKLTKSPRIVVFGLSTCGCTYKEEDVLWNSCLFDYLPLSMPSLGLDSSVGLIEFVYARPMNLLFDSCQDRYWGTGTCCYLYTSVPLKNYTVWLMIFEIQGYSDLDLGYLG